MILRNNVKKGQSLTQCQHNSHLVMCSVGTGSSMLNFQISRMLHLLKANMKHIRQSNINIQYTISVSMEILWSPMTTDR